MDGELQENIFYSDDDYQQAGYNANEDYGQYPIKGEWHVKAEENEQDGYDYQGGFQMEGDFSGYNPNEPINSFNEYSGEINEGWEDTIQFNGEYMKNEEEEKDNYGYQKKLQLKKAGKKIKVIPKQQLKVEESDPSYSADFDNRSEQCSGNFDELLNAQINADCSYAYSMPTIPKADAIDMAEESQMFELPVRNNKKQSKQPKQRYNDDDDSQNMWSTLSEAEQMAKLSSLDIQLQQRYLDAKINRYTRMRETIHNKQSRKDKKPNSNVTQKRSDVNFKRSNKIRVEWKSVVKNQPDCEESSLDNMSDLKSVSNGERKFKLRLETLKALSQKFNTYRDYQNGIFDPGYKMSLISIGNEFGMGHTSVYRLYKEWKVDYSFHDKLIKMQEIRLSNAKQKKMPNAQNLGNSGFGRDQDFFEEEYNNQQKDKQSTVSKRQKKAPTKAALKKIKQRELLAKMMAQAKLQSSKLIAEGKLPSKPGSTNPEYNSERTKNIRFSYNEFYRKQEKKGAKMYFVDECPLNNLIEATADQLKESQNFSVIAVLSCYGNAFWKIRYSNGKKYEDIADIGELCVKAKQVEAEGKGDQIDAKRVLILDSIIMKEEQRIKQIKDLTNMSINFLPHFSQQLNPLEMWFVDLRSRLRKNEAKTGEDINRVLLQYSNFDFGKYFKEMEKFLNKAGNRESF